MQTDLVSAIGKPITGAFIAVRIIPAEAEVRALGV
ncbi:hypothetical protein GGD56_006306 [Rhizobium mongolense]|uniref:Uncharacterized protein n=1 Tax=Rhizobium mongolense TaxID=57676 RepID=A0ABR6IWW6_9HYPH|nr:hypothetical protein [Rhizobium mongolense]